MKIEDLRRITMLKEEEKRLGHVEFSKRYPNLLPLQKYMELFEEALIKENEKNKI